MPAFAQKKTPKPVRLRGLLFPHVNETCRGLHRSEAETEFENSVSAPDRSVVMLPLLLPEQAVQLLQQPGLPPEQEPLQQRELLRRQERLP